MPATQAQLRVRLASGEHAVFRDSTEFELAVRQRVVTGEARIFHARRRRWIPVASHPAYRTALAKGPALRPLVLEDDTAPPAPLVMPAPLHPGPRRASARQLDRASASDRLVLLLAVAALAAVVALAVWQPWEHWRPALP